MAWVESNYSIYRMCEDCDVDFYVARMVREYMGFHVDTIINEHDYNGVINKIKEIRNLNNGKISGIRVKSYFEGKGRLYLEDELVEDFGIHKDAVWRVRKMLGLIRKPIHEPEYELMEKTIDILVSLYGCVTKQSIAYLQMLMRYVKVNDIYELEEVLKRND